MYGPKSRRKRAQLNAFHSTLFQKRNRILEVIVCILRAVRREDVTWRHWFTVNGFDDSQLVGADLDQVHFASDNSLKRIFDHMQSGFQYVGLNTDFTCGGH